MVSAYRDVRNVRDQYYCAICKKTSKRDEDLYLHLCHSEHPYCFYCGPDVHITRSLSEHFKAIHSKFQCPECSREFFLRTSWRNHMRSHWEYQDPGYLFMHDVMMPGESLQDFAYRLNPSKEFYNYCFEIVSRIEQFMHHNTSFRNGRIMMGGSVGKGTAVGNGADIDIMYYLYDTSLDDMMRIVPSITERLRQHILNGDLTWATRLKFEKSTQFCVQFKLKIWKHQPISIDFLPVMDLLSPNTKENREKLYTRMKTMDSRKRDFCKRCLNNVQVDFVRQVPYNLKDVIRVIKFWVKKIRKDERCGTVLSYFSELVVIRTWMNQGEPSNQDIDLLMFVKLVLYQLCFCEIIRITWPECYQHYHFTEEIDGPMVLDPANPFCNLAPHKRHAAVISQKARQLFFKQNYYIRSLPEVYSPYKVYSPQVRDNRGIRHTEPSFILEMKEATQPVCKQSYSITSIPERASSFVENIGGTKHTKPDAKAGEARQTEHCKQNFSATSEPSSESIGTKHTIPSVNMENGQAKQSNLIVSENESISSRINGPNSNKYTEPSVICEIGEPRQPPFKKNYYERPEPQFESDTARNTSKTKHTEPSVILEMEPIIKPNNLNVSVPEGVIARANDTKGSKDAENSVILEIGEPRQPPFKQNYSEPQFESDRAQGTNTKETKNTENSVIVEIGGTREQPFKQNYSVTSVPIPGSAGAKNTIGTKHTEQSLILDMEEARRPNINQNYLDVPAYEGLPSRTKHINGTNYTETSVILETETANRPLIKKHFSRSVSVSPGANYKKRTKHTSVILEMEEERQPIFKDKNCDVSIPESVSPRANDTRGTKHTEPSFITEMGEARRPRFNHNYSASSLPESESGDEFTTGIRTEGSHGIKYTDPGAILEVREARQSLFKQNYSYISVPDLDQDEITLGSDDNESTASSNISSAPSASFRKPYMKPPQNIYTSKNNQLGPSGVSKPEYSMFSDVDLDDVALISDTDEPPVSSTFPSVYPDFTRTHDVEPSQDMYTRDTTYSEPSFFLGVGEAPTIKRCFRNYKSVLVKVGVVLLTFVCFMVWYFSI